MPILLLARARWMCRIVRKPEYVLAIMVSSRLLGAYYHEVDLSRREGDAGGPAR